MIEKFSTAGFFSEIGEIYPGLPLSEEEKMGKLYHYTTFDTFVKIWLSKRLKFGMIPEVNDMLEYKKNLTSTPQRLPLLFALQDIISSYRQISFTMDNDSFIKGCMNPTMWAHYGNKRQGVCIEFDYSKLHLPYGSVASCINYVPTLPYSYELPDNLHSIREIKQFVNDNNKDLFFTKTNEWSIENEFRIICNTSEFMDVQNAITGIYLTSFDSLECILSEQLVGDSVPVKFVHYLRTTNNIAVPVVSETREMREKFTKAKNNNNNTLLNLFDKARKHYEINKHDEDADLVMYNILQN